MKQSNRSLYIYIALGIFLAGTAPAVQQSTDVEMSGISGGGDVPRRHFRLRDPARLDPARAESIYQIAVQAMSKGYARSGLKAAKRYVRWRRYNSAPYLSSTHGNHYINNYANEIASGYVRYEAAGRFPVGSVIAKDSFSVTDTGGILLGPLFLMEKMPGGYNYVSGDWKYSLIQPDGSLLGETNGVGSQRVEYCVACHLAVEHQDHLYFIPPAYRLKTTEQLN